jgi:hypothetical protein
MNVLGAALVMAMAVPTLAAEVGEVAPGFEGSEFINTPAVSMKTLKGKVVLYEIFRTW